MKHLSLQVTYNGNEQRNVMIRNIYYMINIGIESYTCPTYSYALNPTQPKVERPVRFERINDQECMVIQSRMNY